MPPIKMYEAICNTIGEETSLNRSYISGALVTFMFQIWFFLPPVCTNIVSRLRWALFTARSIFNRHYILGVASAPICRWHDKSTTVINLCVIPTDLLQPIGSSKTSRSTHSKNLVIYYYVSNATMSTKHSILQ